MKQKLKNYLLRHLLCVVALEDVIITDKKFVFIGGEQIGENEIKQLQAEIKALEGFRIWKLMTETVRYHAVHKSVHEATNFEHVLSGKMALWTLDLFNSVMKIVKNKK